MAFYVGGRYISYSRVKSWCGSHLDTVKDAAREHGIIAGFASNMASVPPFSIQGLIAGAIKVKPWHYFVGTALSLVPGLIAIALFGREIARALDDPSEVSWWQMGLTVLVFAVFMWWLRRWVMRREKAAAR